MSDKQQKKHFKDTIAFKHGADPDTPFDEQQKLNASTINNHETESNQTNDTDFLGSLDKISQDALDQVNHYKDVGKVLSHHFSGLAKLIQVEARLSLSAYAQVFKLSAIVIPLALIMYISICISIGAVVYALSASMLASILVSTLCQLILIGCIVLTIKLTKRHIGFNKTKSQIEELKNELTHLF